MKKIIVILLLATFGLYQFVSAQCYLTVENSSELDTKAITQISLVQISQHFETVNEIPPQGIGTDACMYTLSTSVVSNGLLVTLKGRNASTYGDSKLRGFDGFQQSLFRAIISAKPETKPAICERYYNLMGSDCSSTATPTPPPETPAEGNLVIRVPHDYRYAQILSNGLLIGEMNGEVVREFNVETGKTLVIKGVDGIYQSEEVYTSVQGDTPTRIDLKNFESTQAVQPPPVQPTPTPRPEPAVREETEKEFAEDGAFIIGFSIGTHNFTKAEEDDLLSSESYEFGSSGPAFDAFLEFFFNQNFGIGAKVYSTATSATSKFGGDFTAVGAASALLITANMWFPLSTKNKGYSHFGITGGVGSASYEATEQYKNQDWDKYEGTGSASVFGAFLDWGGDVFGARLSYSSLTTDVSDIKQTLQGGKEVNKTTNYKGNASGNSFMFSVRWAF